MKKEGLMQKIFNSKGNLDYTVFFTVMCLIAFGVVMVFSSSFGVMFDSEGKLKTLLKQYWFLQSIYGLAAILGMLIIANIQPKLLTYLGFLFYPLSIVLMFFLALFGEKDRGAARTIDLVFIRFQPSELAKLGVILLFAYLIQRWQDYLNQKKALIYLLVLMAFPVFVVAMEDYSTAGIILVIGGGIILVSFREIKKTIFGGALSAAAVMGIMYFWKANRSSRINLFSEGAWAQADGKGRQTVQALLAIGSGGFFGRGLGQSLQKMGRVTQAHHDIIFAIICEELGIFGGGLILLLYLGLLYQLMQIAFQATELYEMVLVLGVMFQIAAQVVVNVGVASNILPNTGMPLPFISYGGSSMLILGFEIGLVLSVAKKNQYRYIKKIEEYQNAL